MRRAYVAGWTVALLIVLVVGTIVWHQEDGLSRDIRRLQGEVDNQTETIQQLQLSLIENGIQLQNIIRYLNATSDSPQMLIEYAQVLASTGGWSFDIKGFNPGLVTLNLTMVKLDNKTVDPRQVNISVQNRPIVFPNSLVPASASFSMEFSLSKDPLFSSGHIVAIIIVDSIGSEFGVKIALP